MFLIFSLSRCGSTALYRALALASGRRLAYEPWYGDSWQDRESLHALFDGLSRDVIGVKHVWDPNGSPFVNLEHRSTPDSLKEADHWVEVNRQILAYPWRKIVFLRRRNQLERTLSDFLGQQTDLWGHAPKRPHSQEEREAYRAAIARLEVAPVDLDLLAWYLEHAGGLEDQLVQSAGARDHRVVYFEDLLGPGVSLDQRMARFGSLCAWLGIEGNSGSAGAEGILSPASKYNDETIMARIPNLAAAQALASRIATRS